MSPEQELMDDLLRQGKASLVGIDEAMTVIDHFPKSVGEFGNMNAAARVGSTALIKSFEQLEDTIASLFRTILKTLGQPLKGLYALDIGEHMVGLLIIDDAAGWLKIVKLRNLLVHEYPTDSEKRFEQLASVHAAIPILRDALERAKNFICVEKKWLNHE
jgi:uncharacterized protein YutE (UPF0331/DUF86 family)